MTVTQVIGELARNGDKSDVVAMLRSRGGSLEGRARVVLEGSADAMTRVEDAREYRRVQRAPLRDLRRRVETFLDP